ncbi:MaoC family dehydratase [Arthrobacter gengyunqii]|uniref:MaoC family dehydratase n=1 Tax=Arthrobacter gengyunqii TaxID=2886940 RepID=A0A9X1LZK6_9MICC|nr:MaoC family dehydratase [Arthrobacter gengyunqii]MCC3268563.1 MaoC family dehydratase [Arthrobacter gengyunqii]UOY95951.1 MaoC family dehydratase [Arthrobacter gengyunqii]
MTTTVSLGELPGLAGRDLGWTGYREVTQEQINTFADATDDHQWIHVDPERAANGPFRAPIAHGFLTVSLAIPFWSDLLEVTGAETKVNYGLDKVRFVSPVRVGAKIRMKAQVTEVTEISGGFQIGVDQVIEADGETKPAVVAHSLYRFYA